MFKSIETNRLIIRPLMLDDTKDHHAAELRSFDSMAPYWSWVKRDKTLSEIQTFLEDAQQIHHQSPPSALYFRVFTKKDKQFLGSLWYAGINWFVPRFEIAYWQDVKAWGNGYMTEAVNS